MGQLDAHADASWRRRLAVAVGSAASIVAAFVAACGDPSSESSGVAGDAASDAAAPRDDAEPLGASDADAGRDVDVLWVGAHPDDEVYLAPLLAERCIEKKQRCRLLVLTAGEAGKCKKVEGCAPDLATTRRAEMRAAAERVGAELTMWDLGDGKGASTDAVLAAWAAKEGGAEALVAKMQRELDDARPRTVYVFDPRHGTSCHPDHRAAGALALVTIQRAALALEVGVVEAVVTADLDAGFAGYVAAVASDQAVTRVPADVVLPSVGVSGWEVLVELLAIHASQFTDAERGAVANAPPGLRATYYLNSAAADASDERYAKLCP